jgi:NhaC family Na+:H+ antiporter
VLLVFATGWVVCISAVLGVSWKETSSGILQSILKGMPAMLIVIVVGTLIASWLAAGIIPMIIYYGLGMITPRFFLLTASAAACVVSCLTGTGYGTIGTIGVAFMGIAHGLGIPPGPAAGALISGAYLGDKISPLAANSNLACAVSRVNIYDHIRHCLWTTVPALAVGFGVYALYRGGAGDAAGMDNRVSDGLRAALSAHFAFSPWLLIPPAITLYAMARKYPVIPGMMVSVVAAVILAVWLQHAKIGPTLNVLAEGYAAHTGVASVDKLLAQGGMASMMRVTLIALCAFAYSGALQKAGLLEPILSRLVRFAHTPGRLILTTGCACIAVELLTGSAFLCILLPGELFGPAYSRLGLSAKNLSRTIGDFGIVGVPLIPWSIAGAFMSGTLGVSVREYAPWAVFCYAGAIFSLIAGFAGWTVARRVREDETQPGS